MSIVEMFVAILFFAFILIALYLPDAIQRSKKERIQNEELSLDIEYERLVEDYWRS